MKTTATIPHRPAAFLVATLLSLWGGAAAAHVVLDGPSAPAASSWRGVFRVSHGCDGLPTTGFTVRLPAGVQGAKPMPKAGWQLSVRKEKLASPYKSHGREVTEDVVEIGWTAASADAALPDAFYDEFVLRATLPATAGPLWFKVAQTCGDGTRQGRNDWVEVPEQGTSTKGLKSPAVLLLVEPAVQGQAHH